jgi:hypothetical protein
MALAETVVAIRVAVWPTIPVIGEGVTGCGRRARPEVGDAPEVDVDMVDQRTLAAEVWRKVAEDAVHVGVGVHNGDLLLGNPQQARRRDGTRVICPSMDFTVLEVLLAQCLVTQHLHPTKWS